MRVLGIDPGSRYLGYGVVEGAGGRLRHGGHGVIRAGTGPLPERLAAIFSQLETVLALYRPEAVAVEGVFTFRNARSALILGHARGVVLLAAAQRSLPVHEYAPAQVKRAVGAGGASSKGAVARGVKTCLGLDDFERADASDALAVAICHLNRARAGGTAPSRTRGKAKMALLADRLAPAYRSSGGKK